MPTRTRFGLWFAIFLAAGLLAALVGCGAGGGGTSAVTPDPVEETAEDPYSARFHVDVLTGEVTSTSDTASVGTSAVFTGTAVSFSTTKLVDEDGNAGVKATAVGVRNRTGRSLSAARVVFGPITNVSAWSDIRALTTVDTVASVAPDAPSGAAVGLDGAVYVTAAHRVMKVQNGVATVFAGGASPGYVEGLGSTARFYTPIGIAVNPTDGALIVVEQTNNRVRRIDTNGTTSLIAGTGTAGGTNGSGSTATFNQPVGVTVSSRGYIYVSEAAGHRVRKIVYRGPDLMSPASYTVSTLAGTGAAAYAEGTGTSAAFNTPRGLATDAGDNVYVADSANARFRMIRPTGETATIAGSGTSGTADGTGDVARFSSPYGITLLPDRGQGVCAIVTDSRPMIRQLRLRAGSTAAPVNAASWLVQTIAGTYGSAGSTDGDGSVALFNGARMVSSDDSGNVYIAEYGNQVLRKVIPNGGFFPVGDIGAAPPSEPVRLANVDGYFPYAGGSDRPFIEYGDIAAGATSGAHNWSFAVPEGVTAFEFTVTVQGLAEPYAPTEGVDGDDSGGTGSTRVVMSTLAGSTAGVGGYVDGMGSNARFRCLIGVAVDGQGTAYTCDAENNAVRRITRDGRTTTVAGSSGTSGYADGLGSAARFAYPTGIAYIDGDNLSEPAAWPDGTKGFYLVVTDLDNDRVRMIRCPYTSWSGSTPWELWNPAFYQVAAIAGDGTSAYNNGPGDVARFAAPGDVAAGPGGVVYVLERTGGNRVRTLRWLGGDPMNPQNWLVGLLAGATDGSSGYADANGASARFNDPRGITVGVDGNVYVADTYNHCIRRITPDGVVTTLAGTNSSGYVDAAGTSARLYCPWSIAAGPDGHLYFADRDNHRIRRVTLSGVVTTVAGTGSSTRTDGRGDAVGLQDDLGIAVSSGGDLYVAEAECIRLVQRIVDVGNTK